MNSTLESSGLSKRKSSRKFSSMGSSWANYECVTRRRTCSPATGGPNDVNRFDYYYFGKINGN